MEQFAAAVNGIWNAQVASDAWGANYEAAKLPTMKIGGKDCQLSSYSGFKLVGVNPHSKNVGWAMILAEYLTSEEVQTARFEARNLGPANIKQLQQMQFRMIRLWQLLQLRHLIQHHR